MQRNYLKRLGFGVFLGLCLLGQAVWAQEDAALAKMSLDSSRNIHDPAVIRQGDTYYLFATGNGIQVHCSPDLKVWDLCSAVFFAEPDWLAEAVPGVTSLWAPDISQRDGVYYLYYAASTFGSNRSVIGLATNKTLDPNSPDYSWEDRGLVLETQPEDDYNAIDPNAVTDQQGRVWLAFGSYWTGIKLTQLDPATGKPLPDAPLHDLTTRPDAPYAVEAPFIVFRAPYYYLFASYDRCCAGVDSTYNVRVGRAEDITGPYIDKAGVPMLAGGGTRLVESAGRWHGPGHNAVLQEKEGDKILYHAYDAKFGGVPTLRVKALRWSAAGWPMVVNAP